MVVGNYAQGRNAVAICERCSIKTLRSKLIYDGQYPDLLVCADCWDPKHPQEYLAPVTDPITIYDPTGDPDRAVANTLSVNWPPIPGAYDEVLISHPLSVRLVTNATRYNVLSGTSETSEDDPIFGVPNLPTLGSLTYVSLYGLDGTGIPKLDELSGVSFNDDGTRMFTDIEFNGNSPALITWSLSTPWDITTASFLAESNKTNDYSTDRFRNHAWGASGSAIYFWCYNTQRIVRINVSTPYTADWAADPTPDQSLSLAADGVSAFTEVQMQFFPDGLSFVLCVDDTLPEVYRYTMTVPWDITTATLASKQQILTGATTLPLGIIMGGDGNRLWILQNTDELIYQYDLSTPYDVTTMLYSGVTLGLQNAASSNAAIAMFAPPGRTELYVGWGHPTAAQSMVEKYNWT